jgi:predicted nucleic acid-binding protein
MAKERVGTTLSTERQRDVWHCRQLLLAARDGHLTVYTSTLTIAECQHSGDGTGTAPKEARDLYHRFLMSGQFVVLVQLTPFVAASARDLRWNHGISLRGADAVHLASALDRRCVEFMTSDEKLKSPKVAAALPALAPLGIRACLKFPSGLEHAFEAHAVMNTEASMAIAREVSRLASSSTRSRR